MKKKYYYYGIACILFFCLKYAYTKADNTDLQFLLAPTNYLVELVQNSTGVFSPENGYYHQKLNCTIEKSCSGFNFWIICFLVFAFTGFKFLKRENLSILFALLISYVLTVFVNASRIITALFFQELIPEISKKYEWSHQAIGIFIYLFFLILFYFILNSVNSKLSSNHAKPA